MKSFRLLLSVVLATYMTGAGNLLLAQETNAAPFSITLAPLQYADVKGNVGKFEALNWMPNGATEGIDVSFVKDINKNISLSVDGSEFSNDNGTAHLTLKDGDMSFLQIDYNAFRKYFDNTGGVYPGYGTVSGTKANSPDLQMDISYFKLEVGLGPISDPFVDAVYEHDSKNGNKSLEQWSAATSSLGSKNIAPGWEAINETVDKFNLAEKKEFAGITLKGQQNFEVDYNNTVSEMPTTNYAAVANTITSYNESPDAKLFGAGVRAEKWMLNDTTFVGLGYHYNHIHATDSMQKDTQTISAAGVISPIVTPATGWNYSHASEDEHILVGNLNSNLTPNLDFLADARYEHMGSEAASDYFSTPTTTAEALYQSNDHDDKVGEHVELRYSGISHTSLYAEAQTQQDRDSVWDFDYNTASPGSTVFSFDRLNRTQNESWKVGMDIVPNRFFIFRNEASQSWENSRYYNLVIHGTPSSDIFLDALSVDTIEDTSTLTWKPYHWIQNSLKYQFNDTVYNPQAASEGTAVSGYPVSENHMLSSTFTYDITVQPIDPLLLMFTYSHVESYVRTVAASGAYTAAGQPSTGPTSAVPPFIPEFNSGDNSWLFSDSYSPLENLTWTNTVCYTLSDNYVNFNTGVPYGSDFKMLNFSTGLDWTFHKWLTVGPKYEHASYRDNSLAGDGNYSANIFMLTAKFTW